MITPIEAQRITTQYIAHYQTRLQGPTGSAHSLELLEKSKSLAAKEQAKATFETLPPPIQAKVLRATRLCQKIWQKKVATDTLIRVNPNGFHSGVVAHLLHGVQSVQKNINRQKRVQFLQALRQNNWKHTIFSDPEILEIGLAAFIHQQISFHQMETLIAFCEAGFAVDGTKRKVTPHQLIDEKGEPTEDFAEYFIPNILGFMRQLPDQVVFFNFFVLLNAFSQKFPSENLFYTYEMSVEDSSNNSLAHTLKERTTTIRYEPNDRIVSHLSSSAHDAFRLAAFGMKHCVPTRAMLGIITTQDVEHSLKQGYRPQATQFPGVLSNTNIHSYPFLDAKTRSDHDSYHADIACRMGAPLRKTVMRCVTLMRQSLLNQTDKTNASVIWELVDGEFLYFSVQGVNLKNAQPNEIAEHFTRAMRMHVMGMTGTPNLVDREMRVTDGGIVCFIDMARNTSDWNAFGFFPEHLEDCFKDNFDNACKLLCYFNEDTTWNILVFRTSLLVSTLKSMPVWVKFLREKYEEIAPRLICKRNNLTQFLGLIDKQSLSPIATTYPQILLSLLDPELSQTSVNLLNKTVMDLITAYLTIKQVVGNRPYIRTEVLIPICSALGQWNEKQNLEENEDLIRAKKNLIKFVEHFSCKKPEALSSSAQPKLSDEALENLKSAVTLLGEAKVLTKGFLCKR